MRFALRPLSTAQNQTEIYNNYTTPLLHHKIQHPFPSSALEGPLQDARLPGGRPPGPGAARLAARPLLARGPRPRRLAPQRLRGQPDAAAAAALVLDFFGDGRALRRPAPAPAVRDEAAGQGEAVPEHPRPVRGRHWDGRGGQGAQPGAELSCELGDRREGWGLWVV